MSRTFEEYLIDVHAKQYVGLDDEMPDDFNEWLQDLSPDEWIEYAEKWNKILSSGYVHIDEVMKVWEKAMENKCNFCNDCEKLTRQALEKMVENKERTNQ